MEETTPEDIIKEQKKVQALQGKRIAFLEKELEKVLNRLANREKGTLQEVYNIQDIKQEVFDMLIYVMRRHEDLELRSIGEFAHTVNTYSKNIVE